MMFQIYHFVFLIIFIKITKVSLNLSIFALRVHTLGFEFKNFKLVYSMFYVFYVINYF
jgi:hypothetical protein